jgi:hypothetical protein
MQHEGHDPTYFRQSKLGEAMGMMEREFLSGWLMSTTSSG